MKVHAVILGVLLEQLLQAFRIAGRMHRSSYGKAVVHQQSAHGPVCDVLRIGYDEDIVHQRINMIRVTMAFFPSALLATT